MTLSKKKKYRYLSIGFLLAAVLVIAAAFIGMRTSGNMENMATRLSSRLDRKVARLDDRMRKAMESDHSQWMDLGKMDDDMVVYRYCDDTLQSWVNEFPIANDNIKLQMYVTGLSNPRTYLFSPLAEVSDSLECLSMGYSWYLVKSVQEGNCKVIGGVKLCSDYGSLITHNPDLRVREGYSLRPVADVIGQEVRVQGRPLLMLSHDSATSSGRDDSSIPLWLSLVLLAVSGIAFVRETRSLRRLLALLAMMLPVIALYLYWGYTMRGQYVIFSPLVYSDGALLSSLGAVLIINLCIPVIAAGIYMAREDICRRLRSKVAMSLSVLLLVASIVGILVYSCFLLGSIIENSSINLDIYKLSYVDINTLMVYLSLLTMFLCIPLLVQALRPVIARLSGIKLNPFSVGSRIVYSLLVALLLVFVSADMGLRKEQSRMELLSGRLSFDRDIFLELRLRGIEEQIANDVIVQALAAFNNTAATIQSRVVDGYLFRIERDYMVSVYVFNNENNTRAALDLYNSLLRGAEAIAPNSHFMYVKREGQRPYYVGLFMYIMDDGAVSRVLISLDSKDQSGSRGYSRIFNLPSPGRETLPPGSSYAHYEGPILKSSYGTYAYPTRLNDNDYATFYSEDRQYFNLYGHTHFVTKVADDEIVCISRVQITAAVYLLTMLFLAILLFSVLTLMCVRREYVRQFLSSYFRSRILGAMMISFGLVLVALASVSVFFVNTRNVGNLQAMMSDKINSISSMINAGLAGVQSTDALNFTELRRLLEKVAGDTDSDITVFSPEGRMMVSTTPMVYERQLLSERMDNEAYRQIFQDHKLYHIQRENMDRFKYYSMYAPVLNNNGDIVALICSPYSEFNYDFEKDTVTHAMTIMALFVFFLTLALLTVSRMVDNMFRPLDEMSRKMNAVDLQNPDYIVYKRKDEISTIVDAYNGMVQMLSDNSRKLAQAERDKAWNEMARQVAHEIKTPLTPMKLQIQRIIRLKEKGDPAWESVFDSASKVLLGHIDILTETANEFSTFAKLYSEEFTEIDLDAMIAQEMAMFDNKDNIEFTYMGFEGAKIMGPRPQLTRVVVNLIVNSVQAIGEAPDGRVLVSLRNSQRDGFYDIVFEDNGPGVPDENVARLFSPNFTTKSGGSGLGLAISRSVLETCGASISYHRSYTLGGACFTICYPKPQA